MTGTKTSTQESPEYLRMSLAAAMTLNFVSGLFYRGARLGCVNLLLSYSDGCKANCAFCGLASQRITEKDRGSFIRVPWRFYPTDEIVDAIKNAPNHVNRVCVSMTTHPNSRRDVISICEKITKETSLAVSLLITPTLLNRDDLVAMKEAGAERIGVAVDAATEDLFVKLRGKPVKGPHDWNKYWKVYEQSLEIFGMGMAGVHLICGIGETEQEMVSAIARAKRMGGSTHLFSFFPEQGSAMQSVSPPPIGTYRRIQLARWLIDNDKIDTDSLTFDDQGRILGFEIGANEFEEAIKTGHPFETSGCPGPDGKVACNRPYGNEKPGPNIRNFPFTPDTEDIDQIRSELFKYE
ncbi:MAG: radical SAM protein [Desulfomonilaceae bacterium]